MEQVAHRVDEDRLRAFPGQRPFQALMTQDQIEAVLKRMACHPAKVFRSVATLSKVERDKLSLTYDKMLQLAEGLKMTLAELIAPTREAQPTARRSIARRKGRLILRTPNYGTITCVSIFPTSA